MMKLKISELDENKGNIGSDTLNLIVSPKLPTLKGLKNT